MKSKAQKYKYFSSIKIALVFFLVGAAYIYFSDRALVELIAIPVSPENFIRIQTYKGIGFLFLTAVLLFILVQREINAARKYMRLLEEQKKKLHLFAAEKDKTKIRLKERNRFIETVLKNLPIGIAVNKTDDSKTVLLNDHFASVYGWHESDLKDVHSFFEKVYPDENNRKKVMEKIFEDMESGDPERMKWENVPITTKDGNQRFVNAQNIPIPGQNFMISTVQDVTEKRMAQKKTEENEKKFRAIFENSLTAIMVADDDGNYLSVNKAAENVFGYSREELLTMNVGDLRSLTHEDARTQYREYMEKKQETGEFEFLDKKGKKRTVMYHAVRIGENFNLSVMMDISLRKEAETKLKENETKFSTLFRLNPVASVFTRFSDGKILEVNQSYCRLFGYSKEELLDGKISSLNLWEKPENRVEMLETLQQKKFIYGYEARALHKNGSIIVALSYLQLVELRGEKAIIAIIVDVTEKKKKERELKESKNLLEKTVNNLNEVVIVADRDRNVLMANLALNKVFGYQPEEIMGRKTLMLHVDEEKFNELARAGRGDLEEKGIYRTRYPMKRKDGAVIDTEITTTVIVEKDGWQSGIISVIRDITEQLKNERRLEKYQDSLKQLTTELSLTEEKQRKQIAANIHDHLSQLLVISKMKLDNLEKELDSEDAKKELTTVNSYISEALEKSRKITYELSPPVLYELGLVETMHWMVEKVEEEQGIHATFKSDVEKLDFPESTLIIVFRIIQELVNNVLKHARAGKLEIVFQKTDNKLHVAVEDNGKGFKTDGLKDPKFQQGGFGLFAVKERVRNLGGRFEVHSGPGNGTNVKFSIPLADNFS